MKKTKVEKDRQVNNAKTAADKYLKEHGINNKSIELFGITSDNNWLHIPILDENGEELFIKSRNLNYDKEGNKEPKYKNSQGSHATLFNIIYAQTSDNIVITEGEIDALRLTQESIPAVSSTGGAGTFPEEFVEQLKDKKIWICYDNDKAGLKGTREVLEKLPNARVIRLPEDCKDICEFFNMHSKKDFARLMREAQSSLEFKVEFIPQEHKLINGKELMNMEFPKMPWLIDRVIYNEGFCFIYGDAGTGKSFIALDIALALTQNKKWLDVFDVPEKINVLYIDKENSYSLVQKRARNLSGGEIPESLYFLRRPEQFQLHDGKGGASDFALNLGKLIKLKDIKLVIIDSFIDLMVGSESSSEDTRIFFDSLKLMYPNIAFLVLHHENKPAAGTYRNSAQRARGSTNINAQAFTMFRLTQIAKSKTELALEQTKARDEQKLDKFMVRMNIGYSEEEGEGKTVVRGFDYMGLITTKEAEAEENRERASEMIQNILAESDKGVSKQEILTKVQEADIMQPRTTEKVIDQLLEGKIISKEKVGRKVYYKLCEPEGKLF